jgi:hypothetical protein
MIDKAPSIVAQISTERQRLRLKRPAMTEAQVLASVLAALSRHPTVARCWRQNTGSGKLVRGSGVSQYIRFGFKGQPDIGGFMKDGRALYVECKAVGGRLTPEQAAFLEAASAAGCVAFVARNIDDVWEALR